MTFWKHDEARLAQWSSSLEPNEIIKYPTSLSEAERFSLCFKAGFQALPPYTTVRLNIFKINKF